MVRDEPPRPCGCGSGRPSWWAHDARGIELGRVCTACEERRLAWVRPEVLHDGGYDVDEPVEADA